MQHRTPSWWSIAGAALAALTMLLLSASAVAQDASAPSPRQYQYRPVPPSLQVRVPPLVGLSVSEAERVLQQAHLMLVLPAGAAASLSGRIATQQPASGTAVAPGSRVSVTLAPLLATVPNLAGLTVARAEAAVREAGLQLTVPSTSMTDPSAAIVAQSPAAGAQVPLQTVVTVRLALPLAVVPNIVGQQLAEARRLLAEAKLGLALAGNLRTAPDTAVVATQDPPAGKHVPPRSTVTIRIAVVPPPTRVPDLIGRSYGEAETLVRAARLRLAPPRRETVDGGHEQILRQSPPAGTIVPPGLEVAVTVAVAPPARPPATTSAPPASGSIPVTPPVASPPAAGPPAALSPPIAAPPPAAVLPTPPSPATPPAATAAAPASAPSTEPVTPIWQPVAVGVAVLLLLAIVAEGAKRLWRHVTGPRPVRIVLVCDTGRQRMSVTGPPPRMPIVSVRLHSSTPTTRLSRAA